MRDRDRDYDDLLSPAERAEVEARDRGVDHRIPLTITHDDGYIDGAFIYPIYDVARDRWEFVPQPRANTVNLTVTVTADTAAYQAALDDLQTQIMNALQIDGRTFTNALDRVRERYA